jgi:chorismate-pyruvate lyase
MKVHTESSSFREDLLSICGGWPASCACTGCCRRIEVTELPAACRELLDHRRHMTTTLESFYGEPVELHVLDEAMTERYYQRQILLQLRQRKTVVEFGIARVDLAQIPAEVRAEVLGRGAPLGDILIRHEVLREIDPRWYFAVEGGCPWRGHFGSSVAGPVFGRLGEIRCNGSPAIEMLEVVSPDLPGTDRLGATAHSA